MSLIVSRMSQAVPLFDNFLLLSCHSHSYLFGKEKQQTMISPLPQLNAVHLCPELVIHGGCTKIAVSQGLGGRVHESYFQRKGCFFKPLPEPSASFCYSRIQTKRESCVHSLISTLNTKCSEKHMLQERLASALQVICPLTPLHLSKATG